MAKNEVELVRPRFDAVFLVCKACGKRSSGPTKLKPKELAGLVRRGTKQGPERARVVLTTCLGLCPKAATAVAHVAAGRPTRLVAVAARKDVEQALELLVADEPTRG